MILILKIRYKKEKQCDCLSVFCLNLKYHAVNVLKLKLFVNIAL